VDFSRCHLDSKVCRHESRQLKKTLVAELLDDLPLWLYLVRRLPNSASLPLSSVICGIHIFVNAGEVIGVFLALFGLLWSLEICGGE
jgi:uncharacterized RDD family membrane protein YckC